MNIYLLDTDALIDLSKKREPVQSRIIQILKSNDIVGICPINIAEFYTGLSENDYEWEEFFTTLTYWPISIETAIQAGRYRHHFLHKAQTLSITDSLVAAVAKENGATIITTNFKDYPMKDIELLSLRE